MDLFIFLRLFGGLALFLYGMSVMGGSLEKAAQGRLEAMLERLTGSVGRAVLFGAAVTAVIHSSSAATVLVVGLVGAGVLRLRQAIGIIMGANIGTTVTAHILRLTAVSGDSLALRLLQSSSLTPAVAILGILLFLFAKKDALRDVGQMLLGFGIIFTGMMQMEEAVRPLAQLPAFGRMFAAMKNPLVGVLVGAVVTAVIQSSTASVGILQAISSTGAIPCSAAVPLILGQNIGTCVTPIFAGIGASRNAKRASVVNLIFNVLGALLFLAGMYAVHAVRPFPFWNDPIDSGGIADFHTLFNVAATVLFLPFTGLLERLAYVLIPLSREEGGGRAPDAPGERAIRRRPKAKPSRPRAGG